VILIKDSIVIGIKIMQKILLYSSLPNWPTAAQSGQHKKESTESAMKKFPK
jgi:hypothetical protein